MADVLILGAGIAGLTAAEVLSGYGLNVTIIEARDRIGGRIFTESDAHDGFPIELGAEFIHGKPPHLRQRILDAGLKIREIKGEPWCVEGAEKRLRPCGEFWEQIDRVLGAMPHLENGNDLSFSAFLRSRRAQSFPREDCERAKSYVEGFNAAPAQEVSVDWLVRGRKSEEKIDGDRPFRITTGYGPLVFDIERRLHQRGVVFELCAAVRRVAWAKDRVTVHVQRGSRELRWTAPRAIIALPLGVLQSGSVDFEPRLPQKDAAMQKLRMGQVVRVSLRFRERFWIDWKADKGSLEKMTFLFTRDEVFPTWWSAYPEEYPVLTGWSPNHPSAALIGQPPAAIAQEALRALARALPISKAHLRDLLLEAHTHDWQSDPFSRGAFSHALVGGAGASRELARPEYAALYFAGEHTVTDGLNGTVNAAMDSGLRAAEEILESLSLVTRRKAG